jgi:hypothetical protein
VLIAAATRVVTARSCRPGTLELSHHEDPPALLEPVLRKYRDTIGQGCDRNKHCRDAESDNFATAFSQSNIAVDVLVEPIRNGKKRRKQRAIGYLVYAL